MSEERLQILKMLQAGQIDAEQASALLAAVGEPEPGTEASMEDVDEVEVLAPTPESAARMRDSWSRFWILLLVAGVAVLFLGALIISLTYSADTLWGALLCGWPLALVGLAVVLLAIWSRRATWMHLRISEGGQRKIAFGFPLPLTLAAWVMRVAQPFIPQLQETGVDDLIIALRESAAHGQPFSIDVQDDEDGERVQLYIG
jgi:hypothetical protein